MIETIIKIPAGENLARNQFDQPTCTPERPWKNGDETPVVHPLAKEVGEQEGGWPSGDIVSYKCPICGTRWKSELPQ
ncbi:hypothetical protein LCGC14_0865610 [marine sediment metagenome]|uniref:Uncharacterized protein n=1 Tax=marine sediment metagenome TaxID=412755 RepID=A0A0F9RQU0_9ZZZZ